MILGQPPVLLSHFRLAVSGSVYVTLLGSTLVYGIADFLGNAWGSTLYCSSLKELFIVLGILLGFSVGSFQIDVVGGWRYMYGLGTPVALLMGLGMWNLPCWFLLRAVQGKCPIEEYKEKTMLALSKLRGRPPGDKLLEKLVDDALLSVKTAYEDEKSGGNFLEVFQGHNLKALTIGGGSSLIRTSSTDNTPTQLLMTWVAVAKVDDLSPY